MRSSGYAADKNNIDTVPLLKKYQLQYYSEFYCKLYNLNLSNYKEKMTAVLEYLFF